MIWLWIDICRCTPLCILGKLRIINLLVFRVVRLIYQGLENLKKFHCKVYSIATMPTLPWEGTAHGNYHLIATIHVRNQSIENCMSLLALLCDFVTSLILWENLAELWIPTWIKRTLRLWQYGSRNLIVSNMAPTEAYNLVLVFYVMT